MASGDWKASKSGRPDGQVFDKGRDGPRSFLMCPIHLRHGPSCEYLLTTVWRKKIYQTLLNDRGAQFSQSQNDVRSPVTYT